MKEKTKIWSIISFFLILALNLQPGYFALHPAFAKTNPQARAGAVSRGEITYTEGPIRGYSSASPDLSFVSQTQSTPVIIIDGISYCSAKQNFETQPQDLAPGFNSAPLPQTETSQNQIQGSVAALTQDALFLDPELNSDCFKIALSKPNTQEMLAVTNANQRQTILVNNQSKQSRVFTIKYLQSNQNQISYNFSGTFVFNFEEKYFSLKSARPSSAQTFQTQMTKTNIELSELSVWRC